MKRIARLFGLAMVVATLVLVAIAGTVLGAGGDNAEGAQAQAQNHYEQCPCEERPCGECVCGECEPNEYDYNWDWSEQDDASGPYGPYKYQRGKVE